MNRKNSFLLERCWTSEGRDILHLCKILYRCQGMRYDAVSDQITYSMVGIGCFHLLGHMIHPWPNNVPISDAMRIDLVLMSEYVDMQKHIAVLEGVWKD